MLNKEKEEKTLKEKLNIIENQIVENEKNYDFLYAETINNRESLKEQRSAMKLLEVENAVRKVNQYISKCNRLSKKIKKLKSSHKSPYFACITFDNEDFYIGKFGVKNEKENTILINDWRAPISSLFYDYEKGKASYIVPNVAKIEGDLQNKKQYKIEKSKMIYCFETNVNVEDEILQATLNENSNDKMKTIVASIQKEQNQIIRKPFNETVIVQGVAGSGKTSIALHRIAYLLYNIKTLKSQNILIFSPNKVFSNYISSVLPALGERNTKETNFDILLNETFGGILKYEKNYENIEKLLKKEDLYKEHLTKISIDFYNNLLSFLNQSFDSLNFIDIKTKNFSFTSNQLEKFWINSKGKSLNDKINFLVEILLSFIGTQTLLTNEEENSLKSILKSKVLKSINPKNKNIIYLYAKFLKSQNLKLKIKPKLLYDDAIALLYIKNYIFGSSFDSRICHVVIDELQDYSPLQLSIIEGMYPCTKTVLGDYNQTIDSCPKQNFTQITKQILGENSTSINLEKSYRSTKQITIFCNDILNLKFNQIVERNGEEVEIIKLNDYDKCKLIKDKIKTLKHKYRNIAIITKTYKEALNLAKEIKIKTISPLTQHYKTGVIATPAYLSKGLEFDAVIVFDANQETFKTELDKQQLYIACTRPLHKLIIYHTNDLTNCIKKA